MNTLNLLFENKIGAIIVDDFLNTQQAQSLLEDIADQPEWCEAKVPEIHQHLTAKKTNQLFSSQYMIAADEISEEGYLELCKEYQSVWLRITNHCGFDPILLLFEYLKNTYHTSFEVAGKNNLTYSPVVARDLSIEVLPHADFGPFDGKEWAIGEVKKQLAWNIYLTPPGEGGETTVYDYVWDQSDMLDESSYGIRNFNQPVKTKFSVKPGMLVLFNSRNFHSIQKSTLPRIAIGGLLGQTEKNTFIAWS
ncbi:MAG: hypothetical protein P4M14_10595 [Gammaproteobacteria bacterium]|nr:hypothetical protein [Gammaproteobacteria bacterium]